MPPINRAGRLSPLGLILLAVTSVGWGLNFPIMKHLLTEWPPLSSRGLCGIVGAAALAFTLGGVAAAAVRVISQTKRTAHGNAPPFELTILSCYCAGQGCRRPSLPR